MRPRLRLAPSKARDKDYVVPGEYELYLLADRRPELYGALTEPVGDAAGAARGGRRAVAPA